MSAHPDRSKMGLAQGPKPRSNKAFKTMTQDPITSLPDAIRDNATWQMQDAKAQFAFFAASLNPTGGFYTLDHAGAPLPSALQELHTTTRMVHSYALGKLVGVENCDALIDQGMAYLTTQHHDTDHGGYLWGIENGVPSDSRKLAYGHVFTLLAGSSALAVGHPDAQALIDDATAVLDARFWEDDHGLFADEWNLDWSPFSTYRGMNANMHGVEALLAAFEATGRESYLHKAGRILQFFMFQMAPTEDFRLPEHYNANWEFDRSYSGNPMFRPAGTTPGHSFELARLLIQYWDLCGRPNDGSFERARTVGYQALKDAWDTENGGVFYTLKFGGAPDIRDRYWWPVTEAIGFVAALMKVDPLPADAEWYGRLWAFAKDHFVDHTHGGWFPEIDAMGQPTQRQFLGKPDIYHALQADLLTLTEGVSGYYTTLKKLAQ